MCAHNTVRLASTILFALRVLVGLLVIEILKSFVCVMLAISIPMELAVYVRTDAPNV
jgi:hypothetical protein